MGTPKDRLVQKVLDPKAGTSPVRHESPAACAADQHGAAGSPRDFAAGRFAGDLSREVRQQFQKTNVFVSVALALACLGTIVTIAVALGALAAVNWPLALAFYPVAAAVIARQQRGLELLVHDGSHRSWCRARPRLNDELTNLLAAWPCFSEVSAYWTFHRIHHAKYGSDSDPCKRRFMQMRQAMLPGSFWRTIVDYTLGWYRETARDPKALLRAAAWHLVVLLIPGALLYGWEVALGAWIAFWVVPQFAFLPWLRFVAELEEHDYSDGLSETDGTFTNVGWLHTWLIHPLKDGYHLIHHAFPSVPQWRHRALHDILMRDSALYRRSLARQSPLGNATTLKEASQEGRS